MYTLLLLLLLKHAFADFVIQGRLFPGNKQFFWSKKLHIHGMDHGIGTLIVFLVFVLIYWLNNFDQVFNYLFLITPLLFGFFDYLLHVIIDWIKNQFVKENNLSQNERLFWIISGFDQMLHYLCYWFYVLLFDLYFF